MEIKLLNAAISSKECFSEMIPHIDKRTFSDIGSVVWKAIENYYASDPSVTATDKDILLNRLVRDHPRSEEAFKAALRVDYTLSPKNVVRELRDMVLEDVKSDLSAALTAHGNEEKVEELLARYKSLKVEVEDDISTAVVHHNNELNSLFDKTGEGNRIKLSPPELQAATGGCLRGHHILIFARPDMGKSTMATELIFGFLKQGLRVMYVGNEDPPEDLQTRFISRLLMKNSKYINENRAWATSQLKRRNWDKFYFVEMFPGTLREITDIVEQIQPDILIVDQARNIGGTGAKDRVRELELVERGIRNLGRQHKMVTVSFTQAGDSAEGKSILNMSDVDSSKTGMQASADLMVGMGASADDEANNIRMLSYPKNKLSSNKTPSRVKINWNYFKVGG